MAKTSRNWRRLLLMIAGSTSALLGIVGLLGVIYLSLVKSQIDLRMNQLQTSRSSSFYAVYPPLDLEQVFKLKHLESYLTVQGYRKVTPREKMGPGSYLWHPQQEDGFRRLSLYRNQFSEPGFHLRKVRYELEFERSERDWILQRIFEKNSNKEQKKIEHPPKQMGFYFAGRLRTQHSVALSDMPVSVRFAVMAIEDSGFLDHHGISIKGTLRALFKDLIAMKFVQGGSTITQQLMKNLFFSREKVLSRKIKEAIYAFITEATHTKEEILEAYLNEVYLGQWNTHEIHGISEATRYYFNRSVSDITLDQAATLAAMIQRPNYYNPIEHPERTKKRRDLVLKRMYEKEFILESEYRKALLTPVQTASSEASADDAAYYMDLVIRTLPKQVREQLDSEPLTIYIPHNPHLQATASLAINEHTRWLEKTFASVKEKADEETKLQAALIAIDVKNCNVLALQGGRSFKETQFNRILQGQRQPGSLFKPFVYLTAFANPNGELNLTPDSEIEDEPFQWEYEGEQVWNPKNYDDEFRGKVTIREALQKSINVPTARVAQMVGLASIESTLQRAGITSKLPVVPSLSLGSADVSPFELAQAYTTVARVGEWCPLRSHLKIYDPEEKLVLDNKQQSNARLPAEATLELLEVLKGVFVNGTAKSAQRAGINLSYFGGKTGTTNEYRDAWFVGFSPRILALVWVGYDENASIGLPGAVAALPIWMRFMQNAEPFYTSGDFEIPDSAE